MFGQFIYLIHLEHGKAKYDARAMQLSNFEFEDHI